MGIDPSRILTTINGVNQTWVAPEDCWAFGYMNVGSATSGSCYVGLSNNGTDFSYIYGSGSNINHPICLPIKKGQTIMTAPTTGHAYVIKILGVKK